MPKTNVRTNSKQHFISVEAESTVNQSVTHMFQLFSVSRGLLLWLLVCFVNLGVHAVHALRPLSIDHSPLLLTGSTAKTSNSVRKKNEPPAVKCCCGQALTFCLGYDLLLCAAPSQTCHTLWSSTRTYHPCWWIKCKVNMSINNHFNLFKSCSSVIVTIPVVNYLHGSVLLNPEFSQDDVMHTTHWVCPRVRFFMSVRNSQNVRGIVCYFGKNSSV